MSSYALSAIQMMAPPTFRRRNATRRCRLNGTNLQQNKNTRSTVTTRKSTSIQGQNLMKMTRRPMKRSQLPNTLTFLGPDTSGIGSSLSTASCTGNIGLSQLTMSQLSDSIGQHQQHSRPNKVARTAQRNRPSAHQPALSSKLSHSTSSFSAFSNGRPINATFSFQEKDETSQPKQKSLVKIDLGVQSSQLKRSQENLLSSPAPYHGQRHGKITKTHTPLTSTRIKNRKRSWMEACMEVMKTPYRKSKSIVKKMAKAVPSPKIKAEIDQEDEKMNNSVILNDSNGTKTHRKNEHSPFNDVIPTNKKNLDHCSKTHMNSLVTDERNLDAKPKNPLGFSQTCDSTKDSTKDSQIADVDKILKETNYLWQKIETTKKEIEKERLEFEKMKVCALEDIRKEKEALMKDKEDLLKTRNELHSICNEFDQKRDKLAVQVWSAEKQYDDKVRVFEDEQTKAVDGLKMTQNKLLQDLNAKKSELARALDSRFLSFDKLSEDALNSMKTNRDACERALKRMKVIHEKQVLFPPSQVSATIENEITKVTVAPMQDKPDSNNTKETAPSSSNIVHCTEEESFSKKNLKDDAVKNFSPQSTFHTIQKESSIQSTMIASVQEETNIKKTKVATSSSSNAVNTKEEKNSDKGGLKDTVNNKSPCSLAPSIQKFSSIESACSSGNLVSNSEDDIDATDENQNNDSFSNGNGEIQVCDSQLLTTETSKARRPNYNLRPKCVANIPPPVGIPSKHILNEIKKTVITNKKRKPTTKKKKTLEKKLQACPSLRSSQKIQPSLQPRRHNINKTCTNNNFPTTKQSPKISEMTKTNSQMEATSKTVKQKRSTRRRRIGGQKISSVDGVSKIQSNIGTSLHSRSIFGTIRTSSFDYRSPQSISVNPSTHRQYGGRQTRPAYLGSPVGVDSLEGPPPIPDLDSLTPSTNTNRQFIAPRFSLFLSDETDSLSFK